MIGELVFSDPSPRMSFEGCAGRCYLNTNYSLKKHDPPERAVGTQRGAVSFRGFENVLREDAAGLHGPAIFLQ
jgi:hypothetical protein